MTSLSEQYDVLRSYYADSIFSLCSQGAQFSTEVNSTVHLVTCLAI